MSRKSKKAQYRILSEIKDQLILQAERWGRSEYYTPLKLEELELEQCRKIMGDLLAERANLEYEMCLLGTDKKEVLRKQERLHSYLRKGAGVTQKHEKVIKRILEKDLGKRWGSNRYLPNNSRISVLISEN